MNILVTGAKGFIGRNLVSTLHNIQEGKDRSFHLNMDLTVFQYDVDTDPELLDLYCKNTDFVYHLAGINRPQDPKAFMEGNYGFLSALLELLKKHENYCPVMVSSSIQASLDNPYGKSKKAGEDAVFQYGKDHGADVYIYRFPNVFGKWCRPNYNSAVATFCYNISRDLPIQVNDPSVIMNLVYIDDVVAELISALQGHPNMDGKGYCHVPVEHQISLGGIVELLKFYKESRGSKMVPDMPDGSFSKKLYATYLSYLPADQFCYPLKMNVDERGSFTEILRTESHGQFSVNISKPGITKGEHWHHTKNEKFVVVSGKGRIRFRSVDNEEIMDYVVSGEKLEVVDIPPGYTHNIINDGDTDLVTFMWCNECFNPEKPDTYFLKVEERGHE